MGFIGALLVLSFLIFFHELGHFLAAKLFGVKVEAFSIGFGKTKILKKQIGDTEYSLRPIPLGGFVALKGQSDIDPALRNTDKDSLYGIAHWKRLVILAAGSFFNLLLAFFLFVGVGLIGKDALAPVVGKVDMQMPAGIAGIKQGDRILFINNKKILTWDALHRVIAESKGALELVILRNNKEYIMQITPKIGESKNIFGERVARPLLGIMPLGTIDKVTYSLVDSFAYGLEETKQASKLILQSIEKMILGVVPLSEVGGVVSIVSITKKASESGIVILFAFSALISVNLGILNLLPIPALDGGHIILTCYEMLTKKIPSIATLYRLNLAGWVVLLGLMVLGLYNDILRILNGAMPF